MKVVNFYFQRILRKIFFGFLLFSISFGVFGQLKGVKHFSVKDGLSNNFVIDITQDGQGFLWIATESGLNRFDGNNFKTYTRNNSDIVSDELNALLYNSKDNSIWIGSQRDGISIFDCHTQSFTDFTTDEGLITNDVTCLTHSRAGDGIWITHYHFGVGYYDVITKEISYFGTNEIDDLKSLNWASCDDGKGNLFIGHDFDGLSIVDIKNKTTRNFRHESGNSRSLPGNSVRTIYIDSQKNIWIGTNNGLALFNPQSEEFTTFRYDPASPHSLGANYVYDIKEMSDGTLWITTDMSGISILNLGDITLTNPQNVKFENTKTLLAPESLSSPNVRALFQDSFDNIWIGHYRRGIDFIANKPPVFQTRVPAENHKEFNERQIWDIALDDKDHLWVGTENEIMILKDNIVVRKIDVRRFLPNINSNVNVNKICHNKNGLTWFATTNGAAFYLNPNNNHVESVYLGNEVEYINVLYADENEKMWIGTNSGLFSNRSGVMVKENKINEQLSDKIIYSIALDSQGKLWIGTLGQGIFVFDQNENMISNLVKDNGFISNAINHLFLDHSGGVWAATRKGLAYFENINNGSEYVVYNEEQELENSFIHAIQEDINGNIWVSTNVGISLWNKAEMKFSNYNHKDGAPVGDFTNSSVCLDKNGFIFFGSLDGICRFNPDDLSNARKELVPVQIIECVALNSLIESSEKDILSLNSKNKIALSHNRNSFRILFSNPDFSQNPQVEYACMMEGLDNLWYNVESENQVTYRNLPPGEYTFKVKSRFKNYDWDDKNIASFSFVIYPPTWLSWYAKLIYAAITCVLIVLFFRSYKRKINMRTTIEMERKEIQNKQELNNQHLQFFTNITHELRTPLTLILGPLEDLVQDSDLPVTYRKRVNSIHASGVRLLNLINQILEFRKIEGQSKKLAVSKGNLAKTVLETGNRYKELWKKDDVKFFIEIDNKNTILYFDEDIIITILNNLLSNAIKYTPHGEIILSLRTLKENESKYTEISVSDTGYGIEPGELSNIFERYYQAKSKYQASGTGIGLALVKSLVELHEGTIDVKSTIGEGTRFSFRLLTKNNYPSAIHVESDDETKVSDDEQGVEADSNSRPIVLVVEDDVDILNYIVSSMENDYEVLSAINGLNGLELAKKHIPDLIVSDVMMPEMDGIELCQNIKEDMSTSHIPIILLTAKDTIYDKEIGYKSGADSYLTKPFSSRLLLSRVSNLLESRRKLAEQISLLPNKNSSQAEGSEDTSTRLNKLDEEFLDKITEIIENNIEDDHLDINFIKNEMNMSYSTFYRKVKGLTGISPNEFLRKVRLKNSVSLLLSGSYQVSEVAYMSGFNDVVYFRKCFKDEYGMSPSEYVKQFKS